MTMTTTDVTAIEPLTHGEAMRRQAHELDRTLSLLRSLDDAAWTAATDCLRAAVGFCRALAGRGHPACLLTTVVPF